MGQRKLSGRMKFKGDAEAYLAGWYNGRTYGGGPLVQRNLQVGTGLYDAYVQELTAYGVALYLNDKPSEDSNDRWLAYKALRLHRDTAIPLWAINESEEATCP